MNAPTRIAEPTQLELVFPTDLSIDRGHGTRVRITPVGPPRKWVRLRVAADRIGARVDNRTVKRLGNEGHFSIRLVGGIYQVDLLGVEEYLTAAIV